MRVPRPSFRPASLTRSGRSWPPGIASDSAALSSHGYAEAVRHLASDLTLEQAIEVTARRTRQYAKRQLTWFRRDPRIVWIAAGERSASDHDLVEQARELIMRLLA